MQNKNKMKKEIIFHHPKMITVYILGSYFFSFYIYSVRVLFCLFVCFF